MLAQQVGVAGRGRGHGHPHVPLSAHLQVALDAGRGVVGTLTLLTVGQEHDQAGALPPLLPCGGDVLVDDALSAIGEVTELRLPHCQPLGTLDRVAVLEAQGRVLAEQ